MKIISTPRPTTTASRTVVLIRSYLDGDHSRSEEHTSELQSHLNLVCRLLLEKKKAPSPPARLPACLQQLFLPRRVSRSMRLRLVIYACASLLLLAFHAPLKAGASIFSYSAPL